MTGLLIGRDKERARLRAWLEDPDAAVVIVRGPAGSGKTALVQSVLTDARLTGSLVGAGKYAESAGDTAFEPVTAALSGAVNIALDTLYDPQAGVDSLRSALGPGLAALSAAGFHVPGVTERATSAPLAGRADVAARVSLAAAALLRWLRGFGAPVILFLDDWRRAPPEVRSALLGLAAESEGLDLTLVAAERDEPSAGARVMGPHVRELALEGLGGADRVRLFGRSLGGEEAGAAAVAWLGPDAPTLPFDILEAARALADAGALVADGDDWRVDTALVGDLGRPESGARVARRARALPDAARRLALAASAWGDSAHEEPLRRATGLDRDTYEGAAEKVVDAGLMWRADNRLVFGHDRTRAAVVDALVSDAPALSAMAERLVGAEPAGDPVHTASLRLRITAGLDDADPAVWRDRFAEGAQAARARADPVAADTFAETAWALHRRSPAEGEAGELIIREAVLAAVDRRDRVQANERLLAARAAALTPAARGRATRLALIAYKLLGDVDAGWETARRELAAFGLKGSWAPTPAMMISAALHYKLSRRLPLPRVESGDVEALALIGEAAGHLVYERSPATAALIGLRIAAVVGPRPESFFIAIDAYIHAALGDRARAAELGLAALARMEAEGDGDAGSLYRALYFGAAWTRRIAALRERSDEVRDRALAEGDVVNAARAVRNHAGLGFRCVPSLATLDEDLESDARQLNLLGDQEAQRAVAHLRLLVALLRDPRGRAQAKTRMASLRTLPPSDWLPEIEVASVWGDWEQAARVAELGRTEKGFHDVYPGAVAWRFHEQLAVMKCGRRPSRRDLRRVEEAARLNPADQKHRWLALQAEQLRLRGRGKAAVTAYATALEAAEASDFRLEAGVIACCGHDAAKAAGAHEQAERFAERAAAVWRGWGAQALLATPAVPPPSEALEAAHERVAAADRANRAKSRLLADVAHELRTPLQGMQGLLDLAAEDGRALDLRALSGVLASLKTVVDDLSEYGALSSGGGSLAIRPVDLGELVRSEVALAASLPRRRCERVETSVDPSVPTMIDSDGPRLRQVLRNLLSNAMKYGGGTARLHLEAHPSAQSGALEIVVTVSDEGTGIPEPDLLRLFEPFERGELSERAGDPGGLGLGLAVSRQVAQRLGGDLTAHNRPEGGACFRFTFKARPSAAAPPEPIPLEPLRVLVCDDVPLIRQVLTGLLRADGHVVAEAADGLEAVAALEAAPYDLAIVDLTMPGLNGLDVLRRVREHPPEHGAPLCVLLTASTREGVDQEAEAAGAAMVLRKPVAAADLRRAVHRLFAREREVGEVAPPAPPDAFRGEARAELMTQIARLTDPTVEATAAAAHRTAGLAAQFGWPELAEACEALETDLLSGVSPKASVERLRRAWATAFPDVPLRRVREAARAG